jgi:hypothetical protein
MKPDAPRTDVERVLETIEKLGLSRTNCRARTAPPSELTGNPGSIDPAHFENMPASPTRFA